MPPATRTRPQDMIAVPTGSGIKPLGYICWFSVPDEDISQRRLKRIWQIAGLDPACLPPDPKAVNAFKRSVREQERKGTFTDPKTGLRTETDVRDLLENDEDVIYQVSRVVRDADEQLVEYPKAIRVWFSKVTGEVGFKPLGGLDTRRAAMDMMEDIERDFEAAGRTTTGATVRTLVRNYIKDDPDEGSRSDSGNVTGYQFGLSGENMAGRRGGVYFVLAKHAEQLKSLAECLDELYEPHGRAYLYTVPMADNKTARQMIADRHAANAIEEMEKEMKAVNLFLSGKTSKGEDRKRDTRGNVAAHHWRKLQQLQRRAAQYSDALSEEQASLEDHLNVLHRQLKKLI